MKYIPLEKQSKRAQKEHHDKQRGSWNGVVPVTRVIPNKRAYDRSGTNPAVAETANGTCIQTHDE